MLLVNGGGTLGCDTTLCLVPVSTDVVVVVVVGGWILGVDVAWGLETTSA